MHSSHNILLTRHQQAAEKTREALISRGHQATVLALSQIELLQKSMPKGDFDALLFTSPLAPQILRTMKNTEIFQALPVFCVAHYTARQAAKAGFRNIAEIAIDASTLAQLISQQRSIRNFIYPCARSRSFDFPAFLAKDNISCKIHEIYANTPLAPPADKLVTALTNTNAVFLFSKRTTTHFFNLTAKMSTYQPLSHHNIIAISKNVAALVPSELQAKTYISNDKNELSMIECLEAIPV